MEVGLAVEEADAGQRKSMVTGRFQMVAGQNAKSASVDRQTLGQAELGREVGDLGWLDRCDASSRRRYLASSSM